MKKLLLLFLLFPTLLFAQLQADSISKNVFFTKVYDVNKTKEVLHQKAQEWIAINFKDANEVIKLNTTEKIIAKGYFNIMYLSKGFQMPCKIYFILEIAFKNNKYKLDMNSFELHQNDFIGPVENYYYASDYDYYINLLKEQSSNSNQKYIVKYYNRLFKNKEKLQKMYLNYNKIATQIIKAVNANILSTSESLFNYTGKQNEKDKW